MLQSDQKHYDIVAEEFRSHTLVDGLWIRAFSESGGDEQKARALYIGHRVEQLKAQELAEIAKERKAERDQAELFRRKQQPIDRDAMIVKAIVLIPIIVVVVLIIGAVIT